MEYRETCVLNGTQGNMCTKWNTGRHVYYINGTQGNMCTI